MHIFSGKHKNRVLLSPKGLKTRPTAGRLREALFNICQGYVEGSSFLDLFAGSGAMGLEAISRGATKATMVDSSRESIRCIQSNARLINEEQHIEIIYGDVFEVIKRLVAEKRQYDIIYADPPYALQGDTGKLPQSLQLLKMIDDMAGKGTCLLAPGGALFLEDSVDALQKVQAPEYLVLQNARHMGSASLHYYRHP